MGALCLMSLVLARPVAAMFVAPKPVPLERLLASAKDYLVAHPDEANAHYTLARVHYLAFHIKRSYVPGFVDDEGSKNSRLEPAPPFMQDWLKPVEFEAAVDLQMIHKGVVSQRPSVVVLSNRDLLEHAALAAKGFGDAAKLDPKNGLYALGKASLLEEFLVWKAAAKLGEIPEALKDVTLGTVRTEYGKALSLALPNDSQLRSLPISGIRTIMSYEAAEALIRLADDKSFPLTDSDKAFVAEAREAERRLKQLEMNAITPVVLSLEPSAHLVEMLDPERVVDFDLRGYGPQERWPWMKPTLGLLVWDPFGTGQITSARQLFGGYTFEIFRQTGYDALAALDDNRDGVLSGGELKGIRVWFDRNSDGRSTPDEVVSLDKLEVKALSVRAVSHDGVHPMNPQGVEFLDGHTVPTWDWMVEPVRERSEPLALKR